MEMEKEILETIALIAQASAPLPLEERATVIGCGSSYNAALIANWLCGRTASVQLPSEADITTPVLIAVSQSGESTDIISPVRASSARTIALVNKEGSTLSRLCQETVMVGAGVERSIPATKSVTLQVLQLSRLLGEDLSADAASGVRQAIEHREEMAMLARDLRDAQHLYVLGEGVHYALSREIALKLKESCYLHAEAIHALEFQHGPIALISPGTHVLLIGEHEAIADHLMRIGANVIRWQGSTTSDAFRLLVSGQLLAFELARLRGIPMDAPRHLSKSVDRKALKSPVAQ